MQVNQEDRISPQEKSAGTNALAIAAIAIVAIVSASAYFYFSASEQEVVQQPMPV